MKKKITRNHLNFPYWLLYFRDKTEYMLHRGTCGHRSKDTLASIHLIVDLDLLLDFLLLLEGLRVCLPFYPPLGPVFLQ